MKVACIQLSGGENYKKNFNQTINYIKKSIKLGADLIITPEATSIITSNIKILTQNTFTMQTDPLLKEVKKISKKIKNGF